MIESHARLDIRVFTHIAKALGITRRYVGDEPTSRVTSIYNNVMAEELAKEGMECLVVPKKGTGRNADQRVKRPDGHQGGAAFGYPRAGARLHLSLFPFRGGGTRERAYGRLAIMPSIGFQADIVHCHDWHTGLVPVYLKTQFAADEYYAGMKAIITIHNLRFQGNYNIDKVKEMTGLPDYLFTSDKLEAYRDANYLKGGIVYSDLVTTVSETYTEEIKTPFYGEKLDGLLWARSNSLKGILNGLDYDEWNPETDPLLRRITP